VRRFTSVVCVLAATVLVSSTAYAFIALTSAGGFSWNFASAGDFWGAGSILSGPYSPGYRLTVNGFTYDPPSPPTMSPDGRQLEFPVQPLGGVDVSRIVYVPESDYDYVRYIDVFSNPGTEMITVSVNINSQIGFSSSISASASGDTAFGISDAWLTTTDGRSNLGHVIQAAEPPVRVGSVFHSFGSLTYDWSISVPPGERRALLHFGIQASDAAAAQAEAVRLLELPDDTLTGIDDYLDDVVNFSVFTPDAPRVRFEVPGDLSEGDAFDITATVEDLEGDTVTFSWDLDGDGTFGEMPGVFTYSVAAGTSDGPDGVRVAIEAMDSTGHTAVRRRRVAVANIAPEITSTPPATTYNGATFRYQIEATDPGGAADPFTYSVVGPMGMNVSPTGEVQWFPNEDDITPKGEPEMITVTVDDGDGGETTQEWMLEVSANRPPTPPVPQFPTGGVVLADDTPRLVAENATDADLDTVMYFFQIDIVNTFDSPQLRESGPISEGAAFTAWPLAMPLAGGREYFWRVWASDGAVESERTTASFRVFGEVDAGGVPDGGLRSDAGAAPPSDDGGCGCRTTSPASLGWVLLPIALLWHRRRR
jgi:MYXO-CTERM domain-containing protein